MSIFKNAQFWLAVVALAQTIVFQFFPSFSPDLWKAIDLVLAVLIGSFTATEVATTNAMARIEVARLQAKASVDVISTAKEIKK
jgi:hypothetical protein